MDWLLSLSPVFVFTSLNKFYNLFLEGNITEFETFKTLVKHCNQIFSHFLSLLKLLHGIPYHLKTKYTLYNGSTLKEKPSTPENDSSEWCSLLSLANSAWKGIPWNSRSVTSLLPRSCPTNGICTCQQWNQN